MDAPLEELADGAAAIARRIIASGASRIGLAPADRSSEIDDVLEPLAIAINRLSGRGVAAVRANPSANPSRAPADGWELDLRGALSVFSPRRAYRPNEIVAALGELFAVSVGDLMTLVDLSRLEAAGLLGSAAELLDASCLVARADRTRERDLERVVAALPVEGFLGVVLLRAGGVPRPFG